MTRELEDRIRVLEDLEAIKKLKARYCFLVDEAVGGSRESAVELVSLFTEDAFADFGEFGRYERSEGLVAFFADFVPGLLSYTAHMVHNPVIEINGDRATGDWYFEVPCTLRATNLAGWLQGRYQEEYVREEGAWLWKSITADFDYATPFDEGWAKTRMFQLQG